MLGTWVRNGVLVEVEDYDQTQRKTRKGLAVVDAKRPGSC